MAKTGTPVAAMAAAAWSCVEKMLHEAQRTSAPRAVRVSMRTAVWIVMWSEPVIRAPASGCASPYSERSAIRPGISVSAISISLRPKSASEMSAITKSLNSGFAWVAKAGLLVRFEAGNEKDRLVAGGRCRSPSRGRSEMQI
jgi:hypothetical protein